MDKIDVILALNKDDQMLYELVRSNLSSDYIIKYRVASKGELFDILNRGIKSDFLIIDQDFTNELTLLELLNFVHDLHPKIKVVFLVYSLCDLQDKELSEMGASVVVKAFDYKQFRKSLAFIPKEKREKKDTKKVDIQSLVDGYIKKYSDEKLEEILWEIIPKLSETILKKEITQIQKGIKGI